MTKTFEKWGGSPFSDMAASPVSGSGRRLPEQYAAFLAGLPADFLSKLDSCQRRELTGLGKEDDSSIFVQGLMQFGHRLEEQNKPELAAVIYQRFKAGRQHLAALEGRGSWGRSAELRLKGLLRSATDYRIITPALAGATVFNLVRAATLGRLLGVAESAWCARGVGATLMANAAGFLLELPTFSLLSRGLHGLSGDPVSWDGKSVFKDMLATAFLLGPLKLAGGAGNKIMGSRFMVSEAVNAAPKILRSLVPQSAAFLGLLGAHHLQVKLGFAEKVDGRAAAWDALGSMLSLGVGFHLGGRLLGPGFADFNRELALRSRALSAGGDDQAPLFPPKLGTPWQSVAETSGAVSQINTRRPPFVFQMSKSQSSEPAARAGKDLMSTKKFNEILEKYRIIKHQFDTSGWTLTQKRRLLQAVLTQRNETGSEDPQVAIYSLAILMNVLTYSEATWNPQQRYQIMLTLAQGKHPVAEAYTELSGALSETGYTKSGLRQDYRMFLALAQKAADVRWIYRALGVPQVAKALNDKGWHWDPNLKVDANLVNLLSVLKEDADVKWEDRYKLILGLQKRGIRKNHSAFHEQIAKIEGSQTVSYEVRDFFRDLAETAELEPGQVERLLANEGTDKVSLQRYQLLSRLEKTSRLTSSQDVLRFFDQAEQIRDKPDFDSSYENFFLAEGNLLTRALVADKFLTAADPRARELAVWALGTIIPRLAEENRSDQAMKVIPLLGEKDLRVLGKTRWALKKIIPRIPEKDLLACALQAEAWITDKNFRDTEIFSAGLPDSLISRLSRNDQLTTALKVAELLVHKDSNVRKQAIHLLPWVTFQFEEKDHLSFALEIARNLANEDPMIRRDIEKALKDPIPVLGTKSRIELLRAVVELGPLEGLNMEITSRLLEKLSEESLSNYARTHDHANLQTLADYHAAHLPWDDYFWKRHLRSSDRPSYLQKISAKLSPYRRGRALKHFELSDLHMAYAGLDSPEGLSFERFQNEIKKDVPPAPFLPRPFHVRLSEISSVHGQIDKGMLREAWKPIAEITSAKAFKSYLIDLVQKEKASLKRIRKELEEVFPPGWESFDDQAVIKAAKSLLPKIWEKRNIPAVANLISHLSLLLAWNRPGIDALKKRIERVQAKRIPSEELLDGLRAITEFYHDTVGDAVRELGLEVGQIPFLRRQRRLLQESLARLIQERGKTIDVEFIPSRSQADRMFGYVAEDCNKDTPEKMDSIYRKDFQINRIIAKGRLSGLLYLQQAELNGKKVLVVGIQPRTRWKVDHKALLLAIEKNLAEAAAKDNYDFLLMMDYSHQQSNRQDMVDAIAERKYKPAQFSPSISGAVFEGDKFLIIRENPSPIVK